MLLCHVFFSFIFFCYVILFVIMLLWVSSSSAALFVPLHIWVSTFNGAQFVHAIKWNNPAINLFRWHYFHVDYYFSLPASAIHPFILLGNSWSRLRWPVNANSAPKQKKKEKKNWVYHEILMVALHFICIWNISANILGLVEWA